MASRRSGAAGEPCSKQEQETRSSFVALPPLPGLTEWTPSARRNSCGDGSASRSQPLRAGNAARSDDDEMVVSSSSQPDHNQRSRALSSQHQMERASLVSQGATQARRLPRLPDLFRVSDAPCESTSDSTLTGQNRTSPCPVSSSVILPDDKGRRSSLLLASKLRQQQRAVEKRIRSQSWGFDPFQAAQCYTYLANSPASAGQDSFSRHAAYVWKGGKAQRPASYNQARNVKPYCQAQQEARSSLRLHESTQHTHTHPSAKGYLSAGRSSNQLLYQLRRSPFTLSHPAINHPALAAQCRKSASNHPALNNPALQRSAMTMMRRPSESRRESTDSSSSSKFIHPAAPCDTCSDLPRPHPETSDYDEPAAAAARYRPSLREDEATRLKAETG